jgi:hypothetical protein
MYAYHWCHLTWNAFASRAPDSWPWSCQSHTRRTNERLLRCELMIASDFGDLWLWKTPTQVSQSVYARALLLHAAACKSTILRWCAVERHTRGHEMLKSWNRSRRCQTISLVQPMVTNDWIMQKSSDRFRDQNKVIELFYFFWSIYLIVLHLAWFDISHQGYKTIASRRLLFGKSKY